MNIVLKLIVMSDICFIFVVVILVIEVLLVEKIYSNGIWVLLFVNLIIN